MSEDRETELIERLASVKHSEMAKLMVELLSIRRERYRDKLESTETEQVRGRAKECKDLIQIFS